MTTFAWIALVFSAFALGFILATLLFLRVIHRADKNNSDRNDDNPGLPPNLKGYYK